MKIFFFVIVFFSVILGVINGTMSEVSQAALTECTAAVTLAISLCGTICFWSGIMNVAEKAGLVAKLAKLLSPLLKRLFKGIDSNGKAMGYILMNLVSNLMGLGNAATPLGIKAMEELKKEEGATDTATDNMIIFTVMNTASLQLFPATITAIRVNYGSVSPLEILPGIWAVSAIVLTISLVTAKTLSKIFRYGVEK
ncbi:MAG: ABC transporter permease [Eubacterium sp.]|nr:ABC transporter permease [Eubacterium sp.]